MKRNIGLLLLGANLWYIGEGMLGPLFSIYAERIGGDLLELTWAWAVYLFVTAICMFGVALTSDRSQNAERMMVAGYAINAICTFSYLLVREPWQLLLVQGGLGVANALATPTWDAIYSRNAPPQRAGLLWGAAHAQEYLITGVAILIGGYVVYLGSFTLLFVVMGTIQVLATIIQALILRRPAEASSKEDA